MNRTITECPMCGSWSGPADGDASAIRKELCEGCRGCIKCGSLEIYNNDPDNPLCLGCYSAAMDATYERMKEAANG